MNEPIVEPILAAETESAFNTNAPLIPRDSVAGRALVVVIAIMTFLACLTAGAALLVANASQAWRADVLRDATIQIKPRAGDDVESLVAKAVAIATQAPDVESAHAYSKAESEKLLEPWLGAGFDLSQLPVPRVIVVRLGGRRPEDLATLRAALASAVPQADLDDHRIWAARLGAMADAVVILAAALFVLMIVAMATAIAFATRGAVAANREIVEVLHLVGASNGFIAREFQIHFRRLGFRGAMIGGLAAIAFFAIASLLSFWWAHSPGGEEIAAMFGSFSLRPLGYLALVVVCVAVTLLTGLLSREIVMRHLQSLQ
ncbi:MAG: ABC transporter permease [Hyphomicrobiales bacterium]|jgi:cell division transport system permease protein|nr:ABC transporter permease [Hyphomicrobiales bacterium]